MTRFMDSFSIVSGVRLTKEGNSFLAVKFACAWCRLNSAGNYESSSWCVNVKIQTDATRCT